MTAAPAVSIATSSSILSGQSSLTSNHKCMESDLHLSGLPVCRKTEKKTHEMSKVAGFSLAALSAQRAHLTKHQKTAGISKECSESIN